MYRWPASFSLLAGPHQLAEEITTLQFLDRYKHAQLLLDQVWAEHGDTTSAILPALHCARLWQDFNLGRSDEAVADAHTLLELGRQLNNHVYALDAVIVEASVALLRGQTQDAAALVDSAEQLIDADADVRRPGLTVLAGWVAASQGDLSRALDLLRPVAEGASSSCNYWPLWPCWMGLFFEIGVAGHDGSFANVVVRVAELAAERNPGVASFEGVALSLRGRSKGDLPMIARSAHRSSRAAPAPSCPASAPTPTAGLCWPTGKRPRLWSSSTGPGTITTAWTPVSTGQKSSASCVRPAPAGRSGRWHTPARTPVGPP
ncbi:hypothetical protein ACH40F_10045 [Streptomyces sp. NPDC020794]|uniref:hypothetical protein n=1 Tax=unclassified Streptomyces TaxID=2593676 RepID=UPI0036EFA61C